MIIFGWYYIIRTLLFLIPGLIIGWACIPLLSAGSIGYATTIKNDKLLGESEESYEKRKNRMFWIKANIISWSLVFLFVFSLAFLGSK